MVIVANILEKSNGVDSQFLAGASPFPDTCAFRIDVSLTNVQRTTVPEIGYSEFEKSHRSCMFRAIEMFPLAFAMGLCEVISQEHIGVPWCTSRTEFK